MKVSYRWPYSETHLRIDDPNTEAYARWCFNQLSDSAIKILHATTWVFYIKSNSWLSPGIAQMFAYHVEPMMPRVNIAILRQKITAELPRPGFEKEQSLVIGAAICELLQQGELNATSLLDSAATMDFGRERHDVYG